MTRTFLELAFLLRLHADYKISISLQHFGDKLVRQITTLGSVAFLTYFSGSTMRETLATNHPAGDSGEPSAVGDDWQQDGEDDGGGGGDARGEQWGEGVDDGEDGGRGGHRPQPSDHLNLSPADERSQLRAQGKNYSLHSLSFSHHSTLPFHYKMAKPKIFEYSMNKIGCTPNLIHVTFNVGQLQCWRCWLRESPLDGIIRLLFSPRTTCFSFLGSFSPLFRLDRITMHYGELRWSGCQVEYNAICRAWLSECKIWNCR